MSIIPWPSLEVLTYSRPLRINLNLPGTVNNAHPAALSVAHSYLGFWRFRTIRLFCFLSHFSAYVFRRSLIICRYRCFVVTVGAGPTGPAAEPIRLITHVTAVNCPERTSRSIDRSCRSSSRRSHCTHADFWVGSAFFIKLLHNVLYGRCCVSEFRRVGVLALMNFLMLSQWRHRARFELAGYCPRVPPDDLAPKRNCTKLRACFSETYFAIYPSESKPQTITIIISDGQ